jgi:hypothetical protein
MLFGCAENDESVDLILQIILVRHRTVVGTSCDVERVCHLHLIGITWKILPSG